MKEVAPDEKVDYQHLVRLLGTAIFIIALMVVAKQFLTPKTYGMYGHYRAASLAANADKPVKYIGTDTCEVCHDEQAGKLPKGKHAPLNCEICHGPTAGHPDNPEKVKLFKPGKREFCGLCHSRNFSRPKDFPQIDMKEHYPEGVCMDCHDPHTPGM